MIRLALPLIALAATTACKEEGRPEPAPAPVAAPGVECNATNLESLIGKRQSPEVTAEARRLSGAEMVRYLRPDMMVTMEFRPDRLNLHLDTKGNIASARCG